MGGAGHITPDQAAHMGAMRADQAAIDAAIDAAKTYRNDTHGLSSMNEFNSSPIGSSIPTIDEQGRASLHKIDDVNIVMKDKGELWGYVYHTTDGRLFVQQDQNSRGTWSGSVGIAVENLGASIGFSPAPATHPEPLTQASQLPEHSTIQPSNITRADGSPAGKLFMPSDPHRHEHEDNIRRDGSDRPGLFGMNGPASGRPTIAEVLGNPPPGSYVAITQRGAMPLEPGRGQALARG